MYRLGTLRPQGLNEDDGFYAQNRKTRVGARLGDFPLDFYSQTRSSVPVANKLMNSLMEKRFRFLIQ